MDNIFAVPHRRNRKLRETYEQYFSQDTREVTVQRIVNIVDKRTAVTRPDQEYNRGHSQNPAVWYGGSQNQQDARPFCDDDPYSSTDRGYSDNNVNYLSFSASPSYTEEYPGSQRDHEPLRRQVELRNGERPGPYHVNRGRGLFPHNRPMQDRGENKHRPPFPSTERGHEHDGYRRREPCAPGRGRSPMRRDAQPHMPGRSGSNNSSRNHSPEKDKPQTYQKLQQMRYDATYGRNSRDLDRVSTSYATHASEEELPHNMKENPPVSAVELEEAVVAASTEPKMTPEENLTARRAQAIADKAMEIEELYKQDCKTFATVVNMLVAKEPSLEQLLHAPLNRNLTEIKQRCLDDLKHFIEELDQVKPSETST